MNSSKNNNSKLLSFNRYLFVPIALILFFSSFYMIYENIKKNTIDEFNNEQLILAETASQGITYFLEDYESELVFLATFNEIIEFSEESKSLMTRYYETRKSTVSAITRTDSSGVILYTYPYNESVIGQNISYQSHVKQILENKQAVLSDVFMSAQGFLAIALHVPVFNKKTFVGSLAILIPMDELGKLYLGKIKNRKSGHAWLLSENGTEIYCPIDEHIGKSIIDNTKEHASSYTALNKIKENNRGTGRIVHQKTEANTGIKIFDSYYVFYRIPLGNTYWTILISYQEEDVYIAISQLRNRLIFVFLFLFIALSYYFYSLTKVRKLLKEEAKRKEAEKSLLKSKEKFQKLFDEHTAVKLLIDPSTGNIIDANESAIKYYGWNCEALKKMSIRQLTVLSGEDIIENLTNVLSDLDPQFEHRLKDGTVRFVEILSSKIIIDNKEVIHSIIHDITKRKKAEVLLNEKSEKIELQNDELFKTNQKLVIAKEKAEESDRLKTSFLHNISHEIRTPMNGIIGFSTFLKDPKLLPEKRQSYASIIIQSSRQLLSIINDIVSIASIEAGQEKVQDNEININLVCKLIKKQFFPKESKSGPSLSLDTSLPDDEAMIYTDSTKLTQVLTNLVGNALKFTEEGYVNFGYKLKGRFLEFFVEDSGIGIPSDMHGEIFKRFRQVETNSAKVFGGSGLGLSISKAYVEMLDGDIWLKSEEGRGSIFYFTVPYRAIEIKAVTKPDDEVLFVDFKKSKTILIAEDEDSNFLVLEQLFIDVNVKVIRALDGIEAIKICKSHIDIDLVLMDIKMPNIDGFEATKRIKAFRPKLPIIAQTAFVTENDKKKALAAGCSDFVTKPIDFNIVLSKIKQQLDSAEPIYD